MKFSIWHLFALTTYMAVSIAVLSTELTQIAALASLILTLLYTTLTVVFVVFGNATARVFAIGTSVPLLFLCATFSFAFGIFMIDSNDFADLENNFKWTVGIGWLLVVACGTVAVLTKSVIDRCDRKCPSKPNGG